MEYVTNADPGPDPPTMTINRASKRVAIANMAKALSALDQAIRSVLAPAAAALSIVADRSGMIIYM